MTSAWNELFMKEMYPRLGRELGAIVQADLRAVESRNARLTSQQIVHEKVHPGIWNMADLGTFFEPARFCTAETKIADAYQPMRILPQPFALTGFRPQWS